MANGLFTALGEAAVTGNKPERPNIWLMIIMVIALLLFMLGFVVTAYGHGIHLEDFDTEGYDKTKICMEVDFLQIWGSEETGCITVYKDGDLNHNQVHIRYLESCSCPERGG